MRPMLVAHHPGFSCPLCRTFADLESDVEVDYTGYDKTGVVGGGGSGQQGSDVMMMTAASVVAVGPAEAHMTIEEVGFATSAAAGIPQAIPEEDEGGVENGRFAATAANRSGSGGDESGGDEGLDGDFDLVDVMRDVRGLGGGGMNEDEVEAMVTSENERVGGEMEGVGMDREEEEDEEAEVEGHVNSR